MSSKRRNNLNELQTELAWEDLRFTFEIVSKLFLKIKLILQNIHVKNKWQCFLK